MARNCLNCGAPIKRGKTRCDYCGADVETGRLYRADLPTAQPIGPGKPANGSPSPSPAQWVVFFALVFFCCPLALVYMWAVMPWPRGVKVALTIVGLLPILSLGTYGYFYETTYAIKSDTPKFSPDAPPIDQRPRSGIEAEQVFTAIRHEGDRDLDTLKNTWASDFEGRWVLWSGTVTETHIYTTMASELRLKTDPSAIYDIEVLFDPSANAALEQLQVGDTVTVSGRLWGYYHIDNRIRLADGLLVQK